MKPLEDPISSSLPNLFYHRQVRTIFLQLLIHPGFPGTADGKYANYSHGADKNTDDREEYLVPPSYYIL